MISPEVINAITYFLAFLISLTFHEAAHAWAAKRKGDLTAEREGRLTLNPISHIDPIGTILMPLLGALLGGFLFAWAKPVPVDLRNLKNEKKDHAFIAAAGPITNLILCFVCIVLFKLYERFGTAFIPEGSFFFPLIKLTGVMIHANAILAVFNLVPIPPLDGGTVFGNILLPPRWADWYEEYVSPYGMMILLMLIISGGLTWIWPMAMTYVRTVDRLVSVLI